jgi:2,4-dienoyl-CoA reductase-like NADH-dependent reductase (Old Yellow Enzyme family)/thioredoxin reductase
MTDQFNYLSSPLKIGNMSIRNRVVFTAHETGYDFTRDDNDGDRYITYLNARAKGGVGLIVAGPLMIDDTTEMLGLSAPDHKLLQGKMKRLADAVHESGARIIFQLVHFGREMDSHESLKPTMGFSALPSPDLQSMPHEMTLEEIEHMIDQYAAYAVDCKKAGIDGVELHGTHGYMLQQSWSWWANKRTDRYGEQMAFACELIDRVRAAVGDDFVISVRISSDDLMPGGLGVEEMSTIARKLEATGKIDMLNTSEGSMFTTYAYAIGTSYIPLGAWVPFVSKIREELETIPIVAAGRIKDHIQAEKILSDGHADMVAMTRAHIVDPEATNKAFARKFDDIRKCISCNQGCIERVFQYQDVLCLQNPATGHEEACGVLKRADKAKQVMIVGAGPAGMECARMAALRGHKVEIYEKENKPGGQVNLICKDPARIDFDDLTRFQVMQLDKLGVPIHTGIEVTETMILKKAPECLVVATGSVPREIRMPVVEEPIPGYDCDIVMTLFDVYKNPGAVGNQVLIFDRLGRVYGLSTALFLLEMGKTVEIVTQLPHAGMHAGATYIPLLYSRLFGKGVKMTPNVEVKGIEGDTVTLINVYNFKEETRTAIDTVIPILPQRAVDTIYRNVRQKVNDIYLIGDAAAPRNLMEAIHDGFHLGCKI